MQQLLSGKQTCIKGLPFIEHLWHMFEGCLIAFGKPAGHRKVAPREFFVHSRWKPAREQKRKEGEEEEE